MKRLVLLWIILPIATAAAETPKSFEIESLKMKFVLIPAGEFMMGSENELGREADEQLHRVKISKPFYMSIHEVTQAQYKAVMGSNPSYFKPPGPDEVIEKNRAMELKQKIQGIDTSNFPVETVSWKDAKKFCEKLTAKEKAHGRKFDLPTEAQWEYACRAGTTTPFHYGSFLTSKQANFDGNLPYLPLEEVKKGTDQSKYVGPWLDRPTTVGSYEPNKFGLYDMHGNVWEWCRDIYSKTAYQNSQLEDPYNQRGEKDDEKNLRVVRGGGWYYFGAGCRCAARYSRPQDSRRHTDGFRVICILEN